mgnify:CR=1 FL=1|tara:strand:- start:1621 stop:1866 length:246 start_codon:yes stop_codon:yes gene_type:complete
MDVNDPLITIAQNYMANGRRSLFIQSDTLLVIEADMVEAGAAPTHANIDVPFARFMLADMNVCYRPARRTLRRELAFQYKL